MEVGCRGGISQCIAVILLLLGWGFVRFGEMEESCLLLEHSASHTRNNTLPLPSNSWK
jgi:hypothetical protein